MSKQVWYEIPKHAIVPFLIPVFEFPIAVIELDEDFPGYPVSIGFGIGWSKPPEADRGELELILRQHSVGGPELLRISEVCAGTAWSRLHYTDPRGLRATYFVMGPSSRSRACIDGPIRMELSVRGRA